VLSGSVTRPDGGAAATPIANTAVKEKRPLVSCGNLCHSMSGIFTSNNGRRTGAQHAQALR
jgi:hypothetical protein